MGLPKIAAYDLPREDEIPQSRVSWTPDPKRAALLMTRLSQEPRGR